MTARARPLQSLPPFDGPGRICAVSSTFVEYVLEQLVGLRELRSRRMFGGVGLYSGDRFFALIDDDVLYLRVDDRNRGDYLARNMAPFRPFRDRPDRSMSYFEAPAEVIEDADELRRWASDSIRAAAGGPARGRRRSGVRAEG